MIGFTDINCFEFHRDCLSDAYTFLKKAGKKSFEAVALFAGQVNNNNAIISEVIYPLQESSKSMYGLMYSVDGEELHRINIWLYQNDLKLIAQIHSHPTKAYHSETDDEFPIITTLGGLSIVVPYFAKDPLNHLTWAYYRLHSESNWRKLSRTDIKKLIKIT
ncbi:MAG: Mov34/MPN/PAD-1 family protein [Bacteroidales bacterium]